MPDQLFQELVRRGLIGSAQGSMYGQVGDDYRIGGELMKLLAKYVKEVPLE